MRLLFRFAIFAVAAVLSPAVEPASAAEPVRRIAVYVQPYYEAARTPDGKPRVAVGQTYDGLLSSNKKEDILAAKERVELRSPRRDADDHDGAGDPAL